MRAARVAAQAKINLILQVGPKDAATGYHDIFTQFQRIDLADDIVLRVGGTTRTLDCDGPRMPPGGLGDVERNLAWRAAAAYASATGFGASFAIELTKNIPVGGGLGGGSADAGAVLRALDALAPHPVGRIGLQRIARSLGADVPFLAGDAAAAIAVGRGDEWMALPDGVLPARELVLAVPPFAIPTEDAYRWLDEAGAGTPRADFRSSGVHDWGHAEVASVNDFEAALEPRFPALRTLRLGLVASGAVVARLSGSGSTVFAVYEAGPPARLDPGADALLIRTRTAHSVVQVEVLE